MFSFPNRSRGAFGVAHMTPVAPTQIKTFAPAYEIKVSGHKLASRDGIGKKSDPFFEVSILRTLARTRAYP